MLEPIKSKKINPNIILVPLLASDNRKYRVGFGKGFYDKFLSKYLKTIENFFSSAGFI